MYSNRNGQSLIEVLIGLGIGVLLIGTAVYAVASMLRANTTTQGSSAANVLAQSLLDSVRSWGGSNWQNLASLGRGAGNAYFLNASGTAYQAIAGWEGVFDNDVTSGLISRWRLDEATGTIAYDDPTQQNPASSAVVVWEENCKAGACVSFDGTGRELVAANSAALNVGTDNFSVGVWVKLNASTAMRTVNKWSSGGQGFMMDVNSIGGGGLLPGGVRFQIRDGSYNVDYGAAGGVNDGNWHLIVASIDRSLTDGFRLYVDGSLIGSPQDPTGVTGTLTSNSQFGIGVLPISSYGYFNGFIDEVRLYNRALSSDEVVILARGRPFSRSFSIENICRSDDAASGITGSTDTGGTETSCFTAGGAYDPSTLKVSATARWFTGATTTNITISDYLTRWKNNIFYQDDWSGGALGGTYTETGDTYTSATNLTATSSIRLQGI